MRIIAGTCKGRRLEGPPDARVRPTSDGLRETLFNVLRDRVAQARVLDVFAGTGAVGLEAISRGASHATFIERDPRVVRVLEQNIAACRLMDQCRVLCTDFVAWTQRGRLPDPFDLVFIDPPYDIEALDQAIEAAASLVGSEGMLVVEHSSRRSSPQSAAGLTRIRLLHAGDSALAFYTAG